MGGYINPSTKLNDIQYSSDGSNWTQATSNADWSARTGTASLVFDNKIWILGGSASSG